MAAAALAACATPAETQKHTCTSIGATRRQRACTSRRREARDSCGRGALPSPAKETRASGGGCVGTSGAACLGAASGRAGGVQAKLDAFACATWAAHTTTCVGAFARLYECMRIRIARTQTRRQPAGGHPCVSRNGQEQAREDPPPALAPPAARPRCPSALHPASRPCHASCCGCPPAQCPHHSELLPEARLLRAALLGIWRSKRPDRSCLLSAAAPRPA